MKRILILPFVICALASFVRPQTQAGVDRTATSSITTSRDKNGNPLITTINRRFTVVDKYTSPLLEPVLLLEEFRFERTLEAEGGNGLIKVDAWSGPNLTKKAWTIGFLA